MNPSVTASITACVICGTPLAAWRPVAGVLCRSPQCAGRHLAMSAHAKCSQCTRPLTTPQMASGVCTSATCRDEANKARLVAKAAREQALLAALRRRRRRSAAQRGIPTDAEATYRVALLPHNTDRPSRLPARRRARHAAHLRACLAEARASLAEAPATEPGVAALVAAGGAPTPATPTQRAEAALMLAGCAACRGKCCRGAGDHSFVSAELMVGYLQRHVGADDDAVVAHYMSHIGEQTMTRGCVYQSATGCTLAAELRADICHRFHCAGLMMLKGQFSDDEPVRAYMVHPRGEQFFGDRFVEIRRAAPAAPAAASGLETTSS